MEKRLNRSDLIFSLAFLLMLIIAVGAFFYGVKVGSDRTEARYATAEVSELAATPEPNAYQQQDLVSFYHTVFLSYREFQNDWFAAQEKWLSESTADRSSSMKELAKSAQNKYDAIKAVYVPPISPQLKSSQTSYLKSLKLFKEGFSLLAATANEGTAQMTMDKVNDNSYYKEGLAHSLDAQKEYYNSMLKWAASVDSDIPGEYDRPDVLTIAKWKTLPLIVKIKVSSDYLSEQAQLADFLPHDLTARIDQFIGSGQADKRKVKSFNAIAELLTSTEAVRSGDFIGMKSRIYESDQLPQLPFFFPEK
ncbi:hypothetical protein [Cohnella luojiensis]|uniref:Uncharacterized protein n=1 Tax=Cohnella luojiensis TaxID=652876 RepID=A0A4Y8M871_9BACL|nr:hypothetical protein [Cohnella luojiensis]TFE29958.1 hypothetical protein E2980_04165 [Cohnella luojiensis]